MTHCIEVVFFYVIETDSYNINLIQKVENTFVFLTEKVFIFLNFSIALYKQEVLKPRLQRNLK